MGKYDFDKVVDRFHSGSYKYDRLKQLFGREDLIPMWVADMDFEAPQVVTDVIRHRLEHQVYGYTCDPEDWWPTVMEWVESHHGWKTQKEWYTFIPGIVTGIGLAVNVFVKPDEKVIIQPPVYHPFRLVPQGNRREVVRNPLIRREDGGYTMDFDNLEEVCDEKCKMLILCNPHNPGGILWDKETLKRLAEFCYDHHILVISDEIHCDMALWGKKHIPFATVSEKAAQCSITFGAPSKTFNIAGIVSSFAVVPNPQIREKFFSWLSANELNDAPLFAPIATIAAFKYCEEWRQEMLKYIEGNVRLVEQYCKENIPAVKPLRPEASFLVWLNCQELRLTQEQLVDLFVNKAKLALNNGEMFGEEGRGFMRMNVALPRSVLQKALQQLKSAVESL